MLAILHVDALSVPLLRQLMDDGRMPVFRDLYNRGTWHDLDTPATQFPAATYFSMHSGMATGEHGMYFSFQWSAQEQRLRHRMDFESPTTVWERLSAAGGRCLLIDPYELGPSPRLVGMAISGWQYRNVVSLERWAVPAGWHRPYERRFGRAPFMQEVFGRRSPRTLAGFRRSLLSCSSRVADLTVELLRKEPFDAIYVSLLGAHQAGHLFWDVAELQVDSVTKSGFEGTLALVYEETDRAVGRILDALPAGTDVIVISPLGMGPNTSRIDVLGSMLERVLADGQPSGDGHEAGSRIWQIRAAVPSPVRAAVARALGGRLTREVTTRLSTSGIDWSSTKAFLLPSDENGQIRLNLRGRERDGIVEPADADELFDHISRGLSSFHEPFGEPVVAGLDRTAETCPGERSHLLPDLVVRWPATSAAPVQEIRSDLYGEISRRRGGGTGRTGGHNADAFTLVLPGRLRPRTPGRRARVADIATTVCVALGLDVVSPGESLLGR